MNDGYTARQLVSYYRYCRANPRGRVLPPGGRKHWDDMKASTWLIWFRACLTAKVSRGSMSEGKGNRAKRRQKALAERQRAMTKCAWCGQVTGGPKFCEASCMRSYYS